MNMSYIDPVIHIGGDEVNDYCYKTALKSILAFENLTVAQAVSDWLKMLVNFVHKNQKVPMVWEEAILQYNASSYPMIAQAWKGKNSINRLSEASDTLFIVDSSYDAYYLDCGRGSFIVGTKAGNSWCNPYKSWQHIYNHDILANITKNAIDQVIGGELALWTELVDVNNMDNLLWPRTAAGMETLWSGHLDQHGIVRTPVMALNRFQALRNWFHQLGYHPDVVQMLWCQMNKGDCLDPTL